jgi:pimeloyl-ACP methyl ester carboxylesterase
MALGGIHCGGGHASEASGPSNAPPLVAEAGLLEVPARDVTLAGKPVHLSAAARLFYNFEPADADATDRPILVLFNGFADDILRPYGTGRMTVMEGGAVVPNASSFTRFANLLYVEPRQSGYSYDWHQDGSPMTAEDCSPDVFNEYVDAADVLLAVLAFLDEHPRIRGPVAWLGESYGGVRVTWINAYLRGRGALAPYVDPLLAERVAGVKRTTSLHAAQILLEGWLGGGPENQAVNAECDDPAELAAVTAALGTPCTSNACSCTVAAGNSLYDFAYTTAHQVQRVYEADLAHTQPDRAKALIGVALTGIPELAVKERSRGFKCSTPDATVPPEDALTAALGSLPAGQSWYVPYSPLVPGKETVPTMADWYTVNIQGPAFLDNLREVPTFLTRGDLDLVVPTRAVAPTLRAILGGQGVDDTNPNRIVVTRPDGTSTIDIFDYPNAGHMISMLAPEKLASDLEAWLATHL